MAKTKPGRELEKKVERVLDQLNQQTSLVTFRIEVKQVRAKDKFIYSKKQPCDYIVIGKRVWAFDAKECSSNKWYPSKAPEHQIVSLNKMQKLGHKAGFLVWFKKAEQIDNIRWVENFNEPATAESGIALDWEMFLE